MKMKTNGIWFGCMAGLLMLVGTSCLDSGDSGDKVEAARNVIGRWVGETSLGETVVLDLNQTLTAVTGTAQIGDINSSITGTIDGDRLEAILPAQPVLQIFATFTSTRMSGTIRDFEADILSSFNADIQ